MSRPDSIGPKRGRHDLAVAWLSGAITLDPTDAQTYYYRGNSWFLRRL